MEKDLGSISHSINTELSGLFDTKKDAAIEITKTLISLLDAAKEKFSFDAFMKITSVEKAFGLNSLELEGCKKAASLFFLLSEKEKMSLKNDLLRTLKSNGFDFEKTLEDYLKKKFGVEKSEKLNSIENPLEDFSFNVKQEISRAEVRKLVREYYETRGYEVVPEHWDVCVKKNNKFLGISISCWSFFSPETQILVTVSPLPKPPKIRKRKTN